MVYSIVQIKTPSNGVQLWWSLWGLVRADQRERRRHQYTGTMQNAPIYQYVLYRHLAQETNIPIYIIPVHTSHYFFGAKFPRQKVLISMFCMFRPWTIVIYTQSALFYLHTECMLFCFIWNLGWPTLKKITRKSGHRCACITCITCTIVLLIIIEYNWSSLIIIDYHWLSLIIIDYH